MRLGKEPNSQSNCPFDFKDSRAAFYLTFSASSGALKLFEVVVYPFGKPRRSSWLSFYCVIPILGSQSFRSFLRYLANRRASSLISVSRVCLLPTLILGISTLDSKNLFNPCIKPLESQLLRDSLFLERILVSDYTYTYVDLIYFLPYILNIPKIIPICAESCIHLSQPVFSQSIHVVVSLVGWIKMESNQPNPNFTL